MDLSKLDDILKAQPSYRRIQVSEAIFKNIVNDWAEVKNLPKNLREQLAINCPLNIVATTHESSDKNTCKALITLSDGLKIETVLLRHSDGRNTVCVSSMVGCPVGCLFCATGKLGFKRNLDAGEIIEQVLFFQRYLKSQNKQVTNIVFMGMGEPLLNFSEVQKAIKVINDAKGLNIGARHISVSTVGVPGGISKLSQVPLQINLAVSLHAPNNELRSRLIPINKDYPLTTILKDVADYVKKIKRKVMFEYIMIKDVNDFDKNAYELVRLMDNYLYFVNLIRYNETAVFQPSSGETIKRFKTILEQKGINVTQRYHFGGEIKAACGQLVASYH